MAANFENDVVESGLPVDDLAAFANAAVFGWTLGSSLAARLGVALSKQTDAASHALVRLLKSEPHAETGWTEHVLRQCMVNQYLLLEANTKRGMKATKIEITMHKNNKHICTIAIPGEYSERQIAAIANEPGGMADLVAMGESDLPDGYEWTGDEEYEIK